MIPIPPAEPAKKKKKKADKVGSAWISFIGRILAQIIGAAASVVFGIFLLQRYQSPGSGSQAAPAAATPAARARRSPGETAIAVLPLANFSGDAKQEYFVDGLTDALTASLAQVKSMRVISRTSAMAAAIARWHAVAGNCDRALQALGDLVARNPAALQPLKNDPLLDSVRSDPRFEALLRRAAARLESKT